MSSADRFSGESGAATIVLIHGAFAESSSWNGVIERLQARGYGAIAVANPLRSLAADGEFLAEILNAIDGPVILVGHSYGGAVATVAARDNENVKGLVYVASFAQEEGETIIELSNRFPGSTLGDVLWSVPLSDGSADLYIQQDKYRQQFAADVPSEEARLMAVTQRPVRDAALMEPLNGTPAWKSIPSWFILPESDRNVPLEAQRFMAERAGARGVAEIKDASHAVAVSQPAAIADIIFEAANQIAAPELSVSDD